MMKYILSQETSIAIHTAGRKDWITRLIKAIVFCSVAEILLFICNNFGDFFNRNKNPVLFWSIFGFIIVFFTWKLNVLAPLFHMSSVGRVIQVKNDVIIDGVEKDIKGGWAATPSSDLGRVDTCEISVQSDNGKTKRYVFKREFANFAREYFRKGDNVICPQFAKFPFNYDNDMPQPFCIYCGRFIDSDDNRCSNCGITSSIEKAEQNMPGNQ